MGRGGSAAPFVSRSRCGIIILKNQAVFPIHPYSYITTSAKGLSKAMRAAFSYAEACLLGAGYDTAGSLAAPGGARRPPGRLGRTGPWPWRAKARLQAAYTGQAGAGTSQAAFPGRERDTAQKNGACAAPFCSVCSIRPSKGREDCNRRRPPPLHLPD